MNLDPARTAVLVDELYARMTPQDWHELAEWYEHHAPPEMRAHVDQLQAAAGTVNRGMERAALVLGGGLVRSPKHEDVPEWIRLGVLHVYGQWLAGQVRTCVHNPTAARPQPVFATAWHPGAVVCLACCTTLDPTPGTEHTCDGCGRQGPLWDSQVTHGPLIYGFGACDDCAPPALVAACSTADTPPARTPPKRKRRRNRGRR